MPIPEPKLWLPGPTTVPAPVMQAMMTPMANHRSPDAGRLRAHLEEGLAELWEGGGPVILLPASGTGGLEALLVNALAPGDPVLAVSAGAFGERFGQIAERVGLQVDWLRREWGTAIRPDEVQQALAAKAYQAVLLTHNETSTGVLHPIQDIVPRVRLQVPLVLVDSISGTPSVPVKLDAWGIDAVVAGSQKGFMLPPGLALIGLGGHAQAKFRGRPGWSFDFAKFIGKDWPYTPPLSLLNGLSASLDGLREEGAEARFLRHRTMAAMVRQGALAAGFGGMADPSHLSPTVTALTPPGGTSPKDLRAWCASHGAVIAGGQGPWGDRVIRIGHVGAVGPLDMVSAVGLLALAAAHFTDTPLSGAAVQAALEAWQAAERAGVHPISSRKEFSS